MTTFVQQVRAAWVAHEPAAKEALALLRGWAPNCPRVAGMDTVLRLAYRVYHGRTVEESAAREYLYRWRLALDAHEGSRRDRPNVFASHYAPHALGM